MDVGVVCVQVQCDKVLVCSEMEQSLPEVVGIVRESILITPSSCTRACACVYVCLCTFACVSTCFGLCALVTESERVEEREKERIKRERA